MYVMQQQDDEEAGGGTTQGESVDPTLGGVFQDKRTWENQLARHILSGTTTPSLSVAWRCGCFVLLHCARLC